MATRMGLPLCRPRPGSVYSGGAEVAVTHLEAVADGIWLAEGEVVDFHGFPYPTRSVVVRLEHGDLWIWSPIRLSPDLRAEIERLGTPAHLVSPNKIHHLYLAEWHGAYADALLWGPRSTIGKRPDLPFQAPLGDTPPPAWAAEIDQVWFNGSPVMDEVVFFHRASRTAILADLTENFDEAFLSTHWAGWQRWIARRWGIVEGRGTAPLEWRLTFFHRRASRAARDRMLAWNPERVIMAHGRWQRRDGRRYLAQAFRWLG